MKCKFKPLIFRISEMQNIFVYGTLQSPELMHKLTGRTFQSHPAVLKGYKRFCIRDADYPAIIQNENSSTEGLLFKNVDNQSLELLSYYEGLQYGKRKVWVLSDNKITKAIAFIWVADSNYLENRIWDFKNFEKNHLPDYLDFVIPATLNDFQNN